MEFEGLIQAINEINYEQVHKELHLIADHFDGNKAYELFTHPDFLPSVSKLFHIETDTAWHIQVKMSLLIPDMAGKHPNIAHFLGEEIPEFLIFCIRFLFNFMKRFSSLQSAIVIMDALLCLNNKRKLQRLVLDSDLAERVLKCFMDIPLDVLPPQFGVIGLCVFQCFAKTMNECDQKRKRRYELKDMIFVVLNKLKGSIQKLISSEYFFGPLIRLWCEIASDSEKIWENIDLRQYWKVDHLSVCEYCERKEESMKRCGGCSLASYCSREHQRKHWKTHKKSCKKWKKIKDDFQNQMKAFLSSFEISIL